jgi:hypothetical protein
MKFRMDATLRFWVDVAYDAIKSDHDNVTKQQLLAQNLRRYDESGDAMRCLDNHAKIAWKNRYRAEFSYHQFCLDMRKRAKINFLNLRGHDNTLLKCVVGCVDTAIRMSGSRRTPVSALLTTSMSRGRV